MQIPADTLHPDAVLGVSGAACGITTIGIIRGDELKNRPLNPTLQAAGRSSGASWVFAISAPLLL